MEARLKTILWKYEPHLDGRCDIKIYVYYRRKHKHYSVGLAVLPDEWDEKRRQVKRQHPNAHIYNAKIRNLYLELEEHFLTGGNFSDFRKGGNNGSLVEYCAQVIERGEKGLLDITAGTLKNYRATLRRLREYVRDTQVGDVQFDDINMDFHRKFSTFLSEYANCGIAGIGKHIKIIKRLMNMALEEGLQTNTAHRDPAFKRFRKSGSSKIYLTTTEIEQIEGLNLSAQPALEKERDRFILSYWFLMRFSDVNRVNRSLLFQLNGKVYLRYQSIKTKVEATLPVKQSALDLMERYDYDFSFSSNVQANRELKTISAMAGLNTHASEDDRSGPKSIFVTTHTARRSAATNLYLEGVSLKMIADLGGWKDLQSLRTYLQASGLDTAQVAGDLDFFN